MRKRLLFIIQGLIIVSVYFVINFPEFDLQFGVFRTGDGDFLLPCLWGVIINATIFYGNIYYLVPKVLRKESKSKYAAMLFGSILGFSALESYFDYAYAIYIGLNIDSAAVNEIIGLAVAVNVLTLLVSFAYRFSIDWFMNERLKEKMDKAKVTAELSFLKSQVNPHFLFNTLNNLFSMAIQNDDEETADGIGKLAALMRYMIYESNTERIELSKEWEYINNYIELQKLRFNSHENVNIKVDVTGDNVAKQQIAPMLLIPFIENAFKYGISVNQPSEIDVQLDVQDDSIAFVVYNAINHSATNNVDKDASGIGLTNAKQRLNLLYPNNHELKIDETDAKFTVELKLNTT